VRFAFICFTVSQSGEPPDESRVEEKCREVCVHSEVDGTEAAHQL